MSNKRDYYEVLGVGREAGPDEVRKAYRQAALKHHPDRNQGDKDSEHRFKEASEAYAVLSDAEKRARYDQFGHAGLEGSGGFDFGSSDIFSHFQDIFSDLFGGLGGAGRARRAGPPRGADMRIGQELTFREAILGCKKEISVRTPTTCKQCDGSGAAEGHSRSACPTCRGSGQVTTGRGFVMFASTCPKCQGEGSIVDKPCDHCHGAGQTQENRRVVVTFPAGIDSSQRLRVPGQGAAGPKGASPGDLYVDVEVGSDKAFERDGIDLVTNLSITFPDAALGATHTMHLVDDTELEVKVAPGTQPGQVLTFSGKGVPRLDGRGKGVLHVVVQVEVPKRISAKARTLLADLAQELGNSHARAGQHD